MSAITDKFRIIVEAPPVNIYYCSNFINPLNAELNPVRHLLALVGARHIVHVSSIRFNAIVWLSTFKWPL